MTNNEIIQAIRNEIERRKDYISVTHFAEDLLSFLSTLEEPEKPIEGLEEEIKSWIPPIKVKVDEDAMKELTNNHNNSKAEYPLGIDNDGNLVYQIKND